MKKDFTRRAFIKATSVAGIGLAAAPSIAFGHPFKPEKTRIALIGVGLRGQNHLYNLLQRTDVEIPAICDTDSKMINAALKMVEKAGWQKPEVYTGDKFAYRDMLARNDIQSVIISTPWL